MHLLEPPDELSQRIATGRIKYARNVCMSSLAPRLPDAGWDAGIFYNVKGPTLTIVGAGLFPDIYADPFHSLDFSINKKIGKSQNTTIDFKISNILNDTDENYYSSFRAQDQPYESFSPGITVGLGISYKL